MSPEQDVKLFTPENFSIYSTFTRKFYRTWQSLSTRTSFPLWTDKPFFPTHLTPEELTVAKAEFKAIPEYFYTTHKCHTPLEA